MPDPGIKGFNLQKFSPAAGSNYVSIIDKENVRSWNEKVLNVKIFRLCGRFCLYDAFLRRNFRVFRGCQKSGEDCNLGAIFRPVEEPLNPHLSYHKNMFQTHKSVSI